MIWTAGIMHGMLDILLASGSVHWEDENHMYGELQ